MIFSRSRHECPNRSKAHEETETTAVHERSPPSMRTGESDVFALREVRATMLVKEGLGSKACAAPATSIQLDRICRTNSSPVIPLLGTAISQDAKCSRTRLRQRPRGKMYCDHDLCSSPSFLEVVRALQDVVALRKNDNKHRRGDVGENLRPLGHRN